MTNATEIKHVMTEFVHINGNVRLIGRQEVSNGALVYTVTKSGASFTTPVLEDAIKSYMKWVGEVRPCLHFGPLTGRPA